MGEGGADPSAAGARARRWAATCRATRTWWSSCACRSRTSRRRGRGPTRPCRPRAPSCSPASRTSSSSRPARASSSPISPQPSRTSGRLNQRVTTVSQDAAMSKERLAQLMRDLEAKQAEAERQQNQIAALSKQQTEAQQRIQDLNVSVRAGEQERALLRGQPHRGEAAGRGRAAGAPEGARPDRRARGRRGPARAEIRRDRQGDPREPADQRERAVQRLSRQPRVHHDQRLAARALRHDHARTRDAHRARDGRQGRLCARPRQRDAFFGRHQ